MSETQATTESVRREAPKRVDKRSSYAPSDVNFQLIYDEAKRLNISMPAAFNVLLDELRQWRSGRLRFTRPKREGGGRKPPPVTPQTNLAQPTKVRFTS